MVAAAGLGISAEGTATAQSAGMYRHGVASGDPLPSRVIIWTRITPAVDEATIPVDWAIAYDAAFSKIQQQGLTYTSANFDYTVKVDVTRLDANTTYYYRFSVRSVSFRVDLRSATCADPWLLLRTINGKAGYDYPHNEK